MPTITATVHQVLRYFFVGAIATMFVSVPPGEEWSRRLLRFLVCAETPGVVVAILVGGCLIYGVHRVVVYPWIFRFILWTVSGRESTSIGRFLWPYGKAVSSELKLEELGPRLEDPQRFIGWASEIHVYYLAVEIALFTLCWWPTWPVTTLTKWASGILLGLLLFLIAAWDQQSASTLVHLGKHSVKSSVKNPVPK